MDRLDAFGYETGLFWIQGCHAPVDGGRPVEILGKGYVAFTTIVKMSEENLCCGIQGSHKIHDDVPNLISSQCHDLP
jgi:hypothetical protein